MHKLSEHAELANVEAVEGPRGLRFSRTWLMSIVEGLLERLSPPKESNQKYWGY